MENQRITKQSKQFPSSIIQYPQYSSPGYLNKNLLFQISNYHHIQSIFAMFYVEPIIATVVSFPTPSAPYLIEHIFLESAGLIVSKLNTSYILYRMQDEEGRLRDQIMNAATFSGASITTPQTIAMPLYFYSLDGQLLDITKYKDLKVRIITKGSFEEMGFNQAISNITVQLKINYIDFQEYIPISLKDPYNIYSLPKISLTTGLTQQRVEINVPFNICNIIFMIRAVSNAASLAQISSVVVKYTTGQEISYDDQTNFTLNKASGGDKGSTFIINYGSRYSGSNYLKTNSNMTPVLADVYFNELTEDYVIYTTLEYVSDITEDKGHLIELIPDYF